MKVLGLAGKAGAGKDYVYELLENIQSLKGKYVARVAFADGVKLDIEEALGMRHIAALREKPYSDEVRWLLQHWGTELRRNQDETYWVRKGLEAMFVASEKCELVVVTDVRFQNEVDAIHAVGGIVAEVYAKDDIRATRLDVSTETLKLQDGHSAAIIDFDTDAVIVNNKATNFPAVVTEFLSGE